MEEGGMAMAEGSQLASLAALVSRLESTLQRLEGRLASCDTSPNENLQPSADVAASISAFDALVDMRVKRVVVEAGRIGGEVLEVSNLLADAFTAEKIIIEAISKCKQPDTATLQKLIQPLSDVIAKANSLTEKRTESYNHVKTLADSLQALTWVLYQPDCGMSLPGTHVEESWQAAEFYNNKVLIQHRNLNPYHVGWAKSMKELYLPGLKEYVLKFHIKGPSWNKGGIELTQFIDTGISPVPAASTKASPHATLIHSEPVAGQDACLSATSDKTTPSVAFVEIIDVAKPALLIPSEKSAPESKANIDMSPQEFKNEEASNPGVLTSDSSVPTGERGEEPAIGHGADVSAKFKNLRVLWETKTVNKTRMKYQKM